MAQWQQHLRFRFCCGGAGCADGAGDQNDRRRSPASITTTSAHAAFRILCCPADFNGGDQFVGSSAKGTPVYEINIAWRAVDADGPVLLLPVTVCYRTPC